MSRSLGLAAYRALSWRKSFAGRSGDHPRPAGELLWLHATSRPRLEALCDLARRLRQARPGLHVLLTLPQGQWEDDDQVGGWDFAETLAEDHPAAGRAFLDHWQPDACLWTGGRLMPNLHSLAADRNLPMLLADVEPEDFTAKRIRWLPDAEREVLDLFQAIHTVDSEAALRIQRLGIDPARVQVTGRLRCSALPDPVRDEDLADITSQLRSRPLWLASHVKPAEVAPVLAAHREALRRLHRLLLVVAVSDPDRCAELRRELEGSGLRHADWTLGAPVDDYCQVLVTATQPDLALWYRAAPVSFIGSSLSSGEGGRSPLEAAALGSALLHGPNVGRHRAEYDRLDDANAARMVRDGEALAEAVIEFSAPDAAARMALAGWQVVTEGAQVTDGLIETLQEMLDLTEVDHARP